MKTIEDAVIELGGKWPSRNLTKRTTETGWYITPKGTLTHKSYCIWINKPDFVSLAKKMDSMRTPSPLGKYRWGVEYPTNGKRPDLPDDVLIEVSGPFNNNFSGGIEVSRMDWSSLMFSFRVSDQRYKPADTSYLNGVSEISENKPDCESVSESLDCKQNQPDISDLIIALSDASNLAVDLGMTDCARDILAACKTIKAKSEREKVIEAAEKGMLTSRVSNTQRKTIKRLYDLGMLVLPQDSGDTED